MTAAETPLPWGYHLGFHAQLSLRGNCSFFLFVAFPALTFFPARNSALYKGFSSSDPSASSLSSYSDTVAQPYSDLSTILINFRLSFNSFSPSLRASLAFSMVGGAELKLHFDFILHQLIKLVLLLVPLPLELHSLVQPHLLHEAFICSIRFIG